MDIKKKSEERRKENRLDCDWMVLLIQTCLLIEQGRGNIGSKQEGSLVATGK